MGCLTWKLHYLFRCCCVRFPHFSSLCCSLRSYSSNCWRDLKLDVPRIHVAPCQFIALCMCAFLLEKPLIVLLVQSPQVLWYSTVRCRFHKKRPQGPSWPRWIHSVSFKRISSRSILILTYLLRLYSLSFSERKLVDIYVLYASLILFFLRASF